MSMLGKWLETPRVTMQQKKNEIKHPFKEEEGESEKNNNENEKYETPKESKESRREKDTAERK